MELWILRLIHIPCAILWAGWAAFAGLYLLPSLMEAGPAGGAVMAGVMKRKLTLVMNVLGGLTLLSGLRLYTIYFTGAWLATGTGVSLTVGALLAMVAFVVGSVVSRPAAVKLGELGAAIKAAGGPPSAQQGAEMAALGARAMLAGRVISFCVIGAALLMAASRFFPFV